MTSKEDKHKEIHKQTYIKKTESQRQGKNLESSKREMALHLQGNPNKINS